MSGDTKVCEGCGMRFARRPRCSPRTFQAQKFCGVMCRGAARRRHLAVDTADTVDCAYFAGLLDGEGCISLYPTRTGRVALRVYVANTDRAVLDEMAAKFGGAVVPVSRRSNPDARDCWRWRCNGNQASEVLVQLRPYLRIKPEQATLAIDAMARPMAERHAYVDQMRSIDQGRRRG